jgi:hypothetical protein
MDDVIGRLVSPEHIREWTVVCNVVAAIFIGPYLAFAATPGASLKCPQAFVRLVHRYLLVGFSLSLMYNAMLIVQSDRVPTGSALLINVMILATVLCSAVRYHWWMQDVDKTASWRSPNVARRGDDPTACRG